MDIVEGGSNYCGKPTATTPTPTIGDGLYTIHFDFGDGL
jgi:hypothetical protein